MQLVHFRSFLCFGSLAAIFVDGGFVVESIFRIVNALCIHAITRHLCKTFAITLIAKVKMVKMVMKRKYRCKKYERKNTVSRQYTQENVKEVPWPTARTRFPG